MVGDGIVVDPTKCMARAMGRQRQLSQCRHAKLEGQNFCAIHLSPGNRPHGAVVDFVTVTIPVEGKKKRRISDKRKQSLQDLVDSRAGAVWEAKMTDIMSDVWVTMAVPMLGSPEHHDLVSKVLGLKVSVAAINDEVFSLRWLKRKASAVPEPQGALFIELLTKYQAALDNMKAQKEEECRSTVFLFELLTGHKLAAGMTTFDKLQLELKSIGGKIGHAKRTKDMEALAALEQHKVDVHKKLQALEAVESSGISSASTAKPSHKKPKRVARKLTHRKSDPVQEALWQKLEASGEDSAAETSAMMAIMKEQVLQELQVAVKHYKDC